MSQPNPNMNRPVPTGKVLPMDSWQSLSLLRFHGDMLKTFARIGLNSVLKGQRPAQNPALFDDVFMTLPAPNVDLVASYHQWSQQNISLSVDDNTTADSSPHPLPKHPLSTHLNSPSYLPAHFFSQFAIAVCAKQLRLTRYPLHRIINQGTGFTVHRQIPLGERLKVVCKMLPIVEKNNRARVHQVLQIGTLDQPNCWEVDFHTLFILGKSDKKSSKKTAAETPTETPIPSWQSVGKWQVAPQDGWQFALLTGDFNPIHWVDWLAKKSPFGQKVLHGFGMFARTIATLEAAQQRDVKTIQIRFVAPAVLNGQTVEVLTTEEKDDEDLTGLELRDASGNVLLVGKIGW